MAPIKQLSGILAVSMLDGKSNGQEFESLPESKVFWGPPAPLVMLTKFL